MNLEVPLWVHYDSSLKRKIKETIFLRIFFLSKFCKPTIYIDSWEFNNRRRTIFIINRLVINFGRDYLYENK
jgi:hypothetical protein